MVLASFIGFMLLFLLIGFASVLVRSRSQADYLLAGSGVAPSLTGLSAVATNNSGFMFIGVIGYTYATGLPAFTMMVGWILGDWMASTLVARRIRETAEKRDSLTFPELLANWNGTEFKVLKTVAAVIAVVLLGVYAAAQFKAGGKALHALFDWDTRTGAIIGAVMVLFYGFSGGLRASIWTDAAQSVVMIVAMTVMLWTAVHMVGGWEAAWTGLHGVSDHFFRFFSEASLALGWQGPVLFLVGWTFAGAAVIGQPHVMVRFMAVANPRSVRRARCYYYAWFIAFYTLAVGVGMMARLLMDQGVVDPSLVMNAGKLDAELALPVMAQELLPDVATGLVLAGLFAATISTVDSLILSCSACLSRDLMPSRWHGYGTARVITLLVVVASLGIALFANENVFDLVLFAWGILGASFGSLLVVYALGGRPGEPVAVSMVVAATVVAVGWRLAGLNATMSEVFPAMVAAWLVFAMGHLTGLGERRPLEGSQGQ
ncbi:high affinity proline permease [Alcanivorax balearicus MACL04]|uniref:Sodium/proline symporter n=1 Tax=Alloalcanivorax balearicus MACL04 TaxID=1177182 RepID=A0ABT2QXX9_9GAMM|nr:sodium/proline symporter [Alloalcanivorax balearicus]MCU5782381.1 high affinity proline permease [Alloalcanivorax balearicus MACL04]